MRSTSIRTACCCSTRSRRPSDLFNILLQVMDYGKLTDHNGKIVISARHLIMTTNPRLRPRQTGDRLGSASEATTRAINRMFTDAPLDSHVVALTERGPILESTCTESIMTPSSISVRELSTRVVRRANDHGCSVRKSGDIGFLVVPSDALPNDRRWRGRRRRVGRHDQDDVAEIDDLPLWSSVSRNP